MNGKARSKTCFLSWSSRLCNLNISVIYGACWSVFDHIHRCGIRLLCVQDKQITSQFILSRAKVFDHPDVVATNASVNSCRIYYLLKDEIILASLKQKML